MFGFLKKKLEEAIGSFTKKAEKEAAPVEEPNDNLVKENIKPAEKRKSPGAKKDTKPVGKKQEPKIIKSEEVPKTQAVESEDKTDVIPEVSSQEQKKEKEFPKETIAPVQTEKKQEEPDIPQKISGMSTSESAIKAEQIKPAATEEKKPKKGFFANLFKKKEERVEIKEEKPAKETPKPSDIKEPKSPKQDDKIIQTSQKEEDAIETLQKDLEEIKHEKEKVAEDITEDKKAAETGFLGRISESFTKITLSDKKFDELFWDLEIILLENNVAVEVIEKIKSDLRDDLVDKKLSKKDLDKQVMRSLRRSIEGLFDVEKLDLIKEIKKKKPFVIVFIGINGTGKTTTLAKLIHKFKENNLDCVVGACDTFRAAAIQQLEEHTTKLGVKLIKHDYGADPAAVAFDTLEHAKAKNKDVVMIDTAGRLHSNKNLMQELQKLIRIVKPDLKIFIGESLAGNDVVEQVKLFNESVGIDGIILTKADTDEKGGAAISVSYITKKPILYLGTGQKYEDLIDFSAERLIEQIGL
ncbi:MAG: signal recognition particle-docking protein FtsY [archaeon]